MLSMQHTMLAYRQRGVDISADYLGGTVMPDAIRAYSGPRQYSHFERSDDGLDSSWWKMPIDMKHVTKESVMESLQNDSHLAENKKAPFGQETDVTSFVLHNEEMRKVNPDMYVGVLAHLSAQDMVFDAFVRDKIVDMSDMSNGRLYLRPEAAKNLDKIRALGIQVDEIHSRGRNGKEYTAYQFGSDADARNLVSRIEQEGIYLLAKDIYEEQGITCDQNWFETVVTQKLAEAYPPDLTEKTMKYMKLDPEINQLIHNHDWSHVNDLVLSRQTLQTMYNLAMDGTSRVDQNLQPYARTMTEAYVMEVAMKKHFIQVDQSQFYEPKPEREPIQKETGKEPEYRVDDTPFVASDEELESFKAEQDIAQTEPVTPVLSDNPLAVLRAIEHQRNGEELDRESTIESDHDDMEWNDLNSIDEDALDEHQRNGEELDQNDTIEDDLDNLDSFDEDGEEH